MNRCLPVHPLLTCAGCLVSAMLLVPPLANAQSDYPASAANASTAVRDFPANALRATLVVTATPNLLIDGKPGRLSPGARIFSAKRMQVLSASLTGQKLLVNLVRDPQGLVHEVWILTEVEARLPHTLATPFPYSP